MWASSQLLRHRAASTSAEELSGFDSVAHSKRWSRVGAFLLLLLCYLFLLVQLPKRPIFLIRSSRYSTEISCAFLAFQAARLKMGLTFEIDSPPVSAVLTTGVSAPAVPIVSLGRLR